ncbi:MAG: hypothetical protein ACJ72Z_02000 [Pyrinomonadaceae bacterium]
MKRFFSLKNITPIMFVLFLLIAALAGTSISQVSDPRMDDVRRLQENNRIIDAQQKDKAASRTKEERIAVVNAAFKQLQVRHNEMMTLMSNGGVVDAKTIAAIAEDVKQQAIQLNANLALPELPKPKEQKKPESSAEPVSSLSEQMAAICSDIRDFVKNINLSPTDPKAGMQARRDLISIVEKSDRLIVASSAPSTKS